MCGSHIYSHRDTSPLPQGGRDTVPPTATRWLALLLREWCHAGSSALPSAVWLSAVETVIASTRGQSWDRALGRHAVGCRHFRIGAHLVASLHPSNVPGHLLLALFSFRSLASWLCHYSLLMNKCRSRFETLPPSIAEVPCLVLPPGEVLHQPSATASDWGVMTLTTLLAVLFSLLLCESSGNVPVCHREAMKQQEQLPRA